MTEGDRDKLVDGLECGLLLGVSARLSETPRLDCEAEPDGWEILEVAD